MVPLYVEVKGLQTSAHDIIRGFLISSQCPASCSQRSTTPIYIVFILGLLHKEHRKACPNSLPLDNAALSAGLQAPSSNGDRPTLMLLFKFWKVCYTAKTTTRKLTTPQKISIITSFLSIESICLFTLRKLYAYPTLKRYRPPCKPQGLP